jgi:preprotein translocase subunit YajC
MNAAILTLAQFQSSNGFASLLFPLAILAIFYFILIVPQRRQLKEHETLVSALQKGDRVVTAGGLIGEILQIKDDQVQIKTGTATVVVERNRIVKRTTPAGETTASGKT